MTRKRFLFGFVAILLTAALMAWAVYPSASQRFSRELAAAARGASPRIELGAFTAPQWERVHIFGPYTDASMVQALGFPYSDRNVEIVRGSDAVNLLLFVADGRVVFSVLHPRGDGDFVPRAIKHRGYPRAQAVFSAERDANGWVTLRPVATP